MEQQEKIKEAIFLAINELNMTLPPDERIPEEFGARLAAPQGPLDSLGLVNLIVETEQQLEEVFGVSINLADQRSAAAAINPFSTVESLVNYVKLRLSEVIDE